MEFSFEFNAIRVALVTVIIFFTASVLAVLDVLKKTNIGFGGLFNSVRIRGVGCGTWMAIATLKIQYWWTAFRAPKK